MFIFKSPFHLSRSTCLFIFCVCVRNHLCDKIGWKTYACTIHQLLVYRKSFSSLLNLSLVLLLFVLLLLKFTTGVAK